MIMLFTVIKRHKLKGKARLRFVMECNEIYAEILAVTQKDAVLIAKTLPLLIKELNDLTRPAKV